MKKRDQIESGDCFPKSAFPDDVWELFDYAMGLELTELLAWLSRNQLVNRDKHTVGPISTVGEMRYHLLIMFECLMELGAEWEKASSENDEGFIEWWSSLKYKMAGTTLEKTLKRAKCEKVAYRAFRAGRAASGISLAKKAKHKCHVTMSCLKCNHLLGVVDYDNICTVKGRGDFKHILCPECETLLVDMIQYIKVEPSDG